jgi:hypothetical protein
MVDAADTDPSAAIAPGAAIPAAGGTAVGPDIQIVTDAHHRHGRACGHRLQAKVPGTELGRTSVATMTKHFPDGGPQKDGERPALCVKPMSKMTELASGAITAVDTVTIELGGADETPAIVIVRWPAKGTVFHPHRFRLARIQLPTSSPPPS